MTTNSILKIPHIILTDFIICKKQVHLYGKFRTRKHKCPKCRISSTSIKGRYIRRISHLSIGDLSCHIELTVRKFRCNNNNCIQKVFSENRSYFPRYSRRSQAVYNIYKKVSIELSGRKGVISKYNRVLRHFWWKPVISKCNRINFSQD